MGGVPPRFQKLATSLPLIVAVALILRFTSAWNYQAHTPHRGLAAVPFLFESGNIAVSLARGHGFGSPLRLDTGPTAWMTPLYPVLLAAIMRIFGVYTFASWVAAVSMNICFSTLTCVPLYFTGKRIQSVGVAATAAWLWAIFPNAILLSYQSLWDTSLSALLGAVALWATLRIADTVSETDWTFYGLLWGIILMANAAVLSLLPPLLGWAAYRNRKWKNAAMALAMIVLACIPWTLRNYVVFHSLVPLRSTLGLQLWAGNNPKAKVIWLGDQHPINDATERTEYIQMGEIAYMAEKRSNAVDYMLTHPAHEAQLIFGRFIMFWTAGTAHPIDDFLSTKSLWFRYVLLFNVLIVIASGAAIVMLVKTRSVYTIPLAAGPLIFPFAYYLTLALPRYKHPIDPTLLLLTAFVLWGRPPGLRPTPTSASSSGKLKRPGSSRPARSLR
jgi:hypothetical protein